MAGYSARQSTYTTGDVIAAADTNDEFNQLLAAFNATTGHTHDGTAGDGGPVSTLRDSSGFNKVVIDNSNNHLEFYVNVSSSAVEQVKIQDGAIVPVADNDIDLGTSSLEFKDAFFDGTVTTDAASIDSLALASGATVTAINDEDDMSSDSATALATQQSIKAYVDSQVTAQDLDLTSDSGTIAIDLDSETLTIQGTSNEIETSASGNALTIGLPNDVTIGNNLTVTGDLTVSGDDITMATNTSGNLLIADGTNFNSVAVGSLSEIATIANDDVFLAVDTSGGGLKKVARSTVVSGLATSAAISNVVEDTTPQLGGDLDMNGNDIVTTSNADIDLAPNGTGKVVVKGNTNPGTIVFNCESNSHGQTVKSQPHSASVTNVLTLPAGGDQEIVGTSATQTLTNKTLTTPVISSISNTGTLTLPTSTDTLVGKATTDTLTNKTLTSAVLNTAVSGTAILDEDNMASDSATQLATQQSIKAYVDSQVATADTLAELSDTNISSPSSGHILVYDGTDSFDNVAVSGDITIANTGVAAIGAGVIVNADINGSAAIDATKIHDGTISNTEFGYLNGVTSAIQTQLDDKASKGFSTAMAIAL